MSHRGDALIWIVFGTAIVVALIGGLIVQALEPYLE